MKRVQIRNFLFWSVFSCIKTEFRDLWIIWTLWIWTLFTQCQCSSNNKLAMMWPYISEEWLIIFSFTPTIYLKELKSFAKVLSVFSIFNITLTNLHKCTACLIDFFLLIFRMMYWPRGRVWGGSSALNAMVYIRGHAYDYDRWEKEGGAEGWSYADCLPYFKKSQTHQLGG